MPIADDTMLLKLTVRKIGASRKIKGEDLDVTVGREMNPSFFKATKKLWSCSEFDECNKAANAARTFVASKAVPAAFVGRGFHLLSVERYSLIDEGLKAVQLDLANKVEEFVEVYEERVAESQAELARQSISFSADEYPTVDEIRDGFSVTWQPMDLGVPKSLERINAVAFAEAKRNAESRWQTALGEVELVLAGELKKLLDRMVERLTPGNSGKKKIFRDSLIGNLKDFLEEMPFRNVCNSAQLDQLCAEITDVLGDETAASLRTSEGMRTSVRDRMDLVSTMIEATIIDAPKRKIVVLPPAEEVGG